MNYYKFVIINNKFIIIITILHERKINTHIFLTKFDQRCLLISRIKIKY